MPLPTKLNLILPLRFFFAFTNSQQLHVGLIDAVMMWHLSQTYKNKMLLTWVNKRDLKDLLLVEALT